MIKPLGLSLFFPCYNDAGTIGSMVSAADVVASEFTDDYEILVIDDGSSDSSRAILKDLGKKFPRLRLVFHEKNMGYGAVIRRGLQETSKDLVFYTDGDGQYDVYNLRHLLPIMQDGVDVVNGYKIMRNDPWVRILIGELYIFLMRLLFGFRIRDIDCDFRLMRRMIFERISLTRDSGVICLEMVKKLELAGFHFAEYPVSHYHRLYGKSQFFRIPRLVRTAIQIVQLWWELIVQKKSPRHIAHPEDGVPDVSNPSLTKDRKEAP